MPGSIALRLRKVHDSLHRLGEELARRLWDGEPFSPTNAGYGAPVTLRFADAVGEILRAVPRKKELPPLPFQRERQLTDESRKEEIHA